jgi:hypothetical protein
VSAALWCSIASGFNWPSKVLSSTVDRAPSTRELNFMVTAKSGPSTVAFSFGVDSTITA